MGLSQTISMLPSIGTAGGGPLTYVGTVTVKLKVLPRPDHSSLRGDYPSVAATSYKY
jgi:hypothetical protein